MLRLASMWGVLLLAFVIGYAAHSVGVFSVILAIGIVVHFVLRFTVWR